MTRSLRELIDEINPGQGAANLAAEEGACGFFARYIKLRGKPWSLERHEYLRAIVEDESQHIVIEKAAQLGVSTAVIGRMILACLGGFKAGYFLESRPFMTTFVQDRFDKIINADETLAGAVSEGEHEVVVRGRRKRADSVRLKHIGDGSAYFGVTQKRGDVKSVDLDLVILDEVAELDPELVDWIDDRLLHSDYKRRIELSQPNLPGLDIDEAFRESDQKHWALRCARCRKWCVTELEFPTCLAWVDGKRRIHAGDFVNDPTCRGLGVQMFRLVCPRCGARLDPAAGEWVAQIAARRGSHISGYHLSQLYGPAITAPEIAEKWIKAQRRPSKMANFSISILGQPYAGDRQPLTEELLATRCGDWRPGRGENAPSGVAFAGVDVGDMCHLAIIRRGDDGKYRVVWGEETGSWDQLERRLREYDARMAVVDAMPYKTSAKALCRAYKRAAISYMNAGRTTYSIEDGETEPVHVINCSRTEVTDLLVDAITAGDLLLPHPREQITQAMKAHLKNLVKDKDAQGVFSYRRGLDDHYAQALIRALLAAGGATALGIHEPVAITREGFSRRRSGPYTTPW